MNSKIIYFSLLTIILLTSCRNTNSIRLKDISDLEIEALSNPGISKKLDSANIVHIDKKERIVTIRCDCPVEHDGYYVTLQEPNNKENSLIKIYDTSYESIYIADILEGLPKINDSLYLVSEERSRKLDNIFTEATID